MLGEDGHSTQTAMWTHLSYVSLHRGGGEGKGRRGGEEGGGGEGVGGVGRREEVGWEHVHMMFKGAHMYMYM